MRWFLKAIFSDSMCCARTAALQGGTKSAGEGQHEVPAAINALCKSSVQKTCPKLAPQTFPNPSKIEPKSSLEGPRYTQEAWEIPMRGPRASKRRPKSAQEAPKSVPKAPKTSPDPSRMRPWRRPRLVFWRFFGYLFFDDKIHGFSAPFLWIFYLWIFWKYR